jgi:hypothetical protein
MAFGEITGASPLELEKMREAHKESPLYRNHNIPFDIAYCLKDIGKQPDDYDGPQRVCKRRATKKDEYPDGTYEKEAYGACCVFHGGDLAKHGVEDNLEDGRTAAITHGAYADYEHLKMDFNDTEQELYDSIMQDWPEIYDWPPESEDPARYRILRRVAVNEVRAEREESYIDGQEVVTVPVTDDNGNVVDEREEENPLSREYRLLMSEVTDQMKELGLTPKERQKMDTLSAQEDKDSNLSQIASDAIHGDDQEYDPDQFDE